MSEFKGSVNDAGGGQVEIVVDRDTESYPEVGSRVTVKVAMTGEEYGAAQFQVKAATEAFLAAIEDVDLDGMLAMISRADTLGPFLDPTLYRAGMEPMQLIRGMVEDTRRYRQELREFRQAMMWRGLVIDAARKARIEELKARLERRSFWPARHMLTAAQAAERLGEPVDDELRRALVLLTGEGVLAQVTLPEQVWTRWEMAYRFAGWEG